MSGQRVGRIGVGPVLYVRSCRSRLHVPVGGDLHRRFGRLSVVSLSRRQIGFHMLCR